MIDSFLGEKPSGVKNVDFKKFTFVTAKVIDIILDSKHIDYKKMGGNTGLGAIKYEILEDTPTSNKNTLTYALPLLSFIKHYPLVGETVLIFNGLPTVNSGNKNIVTFSYYISTVNLFNTPHINFLGKPYKENKYFKEKVEFHPLFAQEGDLIIEGRNNQSIRFTSDKDGFPRAILRVTSKLPKQNDKASFIEENIDIDENIAIFSTKGKVPINVAYGKLLSYNLNITSNSNSIISTDIQNKVSTGSNSSTDNSTLKPLNDVKVIEKEKELFQINLEEVVVKSKRLPTVKEEDDFNVPEFTFLESDKFGLEIIPIANSQDFGQFLYEQSLELGQEPKVEIDLEKTPDKNISVGTAAIIKSSNFEHYLGTIQDSTIPIAAKALLDVLSFCEGTMGRGINGYNILQQIPRTNECAFIADWVDNPTYSKGHPNQRYIWYKYPKKTTVEYVQLFSTASGRYQFINDTWNRVANKTGLKTFTRSNQNINANFLLKESLGGDYFEMYNKIVNNENSFYRILTKLSPIWDSIPEGNSIYSYNTRVKVKANNRQKCRINQETIKNLFIRAYNYYQNPLI